MTRLEQLRERIKTDEGLIDTLVDYCYFIQCCCGCTDVCETCKYSSRNESGGYDCYYVGQEEGFECHNKSIREQLVEYLNEEGES